MTYDWELPVQALRDELQEYGALLNLFDEQQAAILRRDPDAVLSLHDAVDAQLRTIKNCRKRREALVREVAERAELPPDTSLSKLVDFFPAPMRPLVRALIDEVNSLLGRGKRRARQNQMLLARSIEVAEILLQKLNPEAMTKTYSRKGRLNLVAAAVQSRTFARG